MDKFYHKPTAIAGLIEVGIIPEHLRLNPIPNRGASYYDDVLPLELEGLFIECADFLNVQLTGRRHAINAQLDKLASLWHTDSLLPGNTHLLVCLGSNFEKSGTLFRQNQIIVQSKPWHIYYVDKDIEHRAAKVKENRILYRFTCGAN